MKQFASLLVAAIALLPGGCDKEEGPPVDPMLIEGSVDALYRHLGITRWARPLSKQSAQHYKQAQVIHVLDGKEEVLSSLPLGPTNVRNDGHLEVMIQTYSDNGFVTSLAFVAPDAAFHTSPCPEKKSVYSFCRSGFGYRPDEWQSEVLLMAGGKGEVSTDINDPKNLEKVLLRLVE